MKGLFDSGGSGTSQTCVLGKNADGSCFYDAAQDFNSSGKLDMGDLLSTESATSKKWSNLLSMASDYLSEDDSGSTPQGTSDVSPKITINGLEAPGQNATSMTYSPLLTGDITKTGRLRRASQ